MWWSPFPSLPCVMKFPRGGIDHVRWNAPVDGILQMESGSTAIRRHPGLRMTWQDQQKMRSRFYQCWRFVFLLMSNDLDVHFHSTSFGFLFAVILSWFVQGQWLDVPNALWHGCWIRRLPCDWRTPIVDWLDVLKLRMFCTHECC